MYYARLSYKKSVWHTEESVFLQFWYGQYEFIIIFGQSSVEACHTIKNKDFNNIFNKSTITANFLQNLEMLHPGIHLK